MGRDVLRRWRELVFDPFIGRAEPKLEFVLFAVKVFVIPIPQARDRNDSVFSWSTGASQPTGMRTALNCDIRPEWFSQR